jgi:exodeoxyribonuclease-3
MNTLKIASWNVNSLRVRLPHVLQWLLSEQPDVLVLQELKMLTEDFPLEEIRKAGYEAIVNGQKTYNGVAILFKHTAENVVTELPGFEDLQRRVLAATLQGVRIVNLYVPNGESLASDKYQYKLRWLSHLRTFLQEESKKYPNMIILGDFNIAPNDCDVHNSAAWAGQVLCSDLERAELQAILQLGFEDCFRKHEPTEKAYSWWDYRLNAFKRNMGLRIDLILASISLAKHCHECVIDKTPRAWERPSDHAPVVASFKGYL